MVDETSWTDQNYRRKKAAYLDGRARGLSDDETLKALVRWAALREKWGDVDELCKGREDLRAFQGCGYAAHHEAGHVVAHVIEYGIEYVTIDCPAVWHGQGLPKYQLVRDDDDMTFSPAIVAYAGPMAQVRFQKKALDRDFLDLYARDDVEKVEKWATEKRERGCQRAAEEIKCEARDKTNRLLENHVAEIFLLAEALLRDGMLCRDRVNYIIGEYGKRNIETPPEIPESINVPDSWFHPPAPNL